MKYVKQAIISSFALLMFGGTLALDTSAQTRRGIAVVRTQRPIVVRRVVRPYYYGHRTWRSPYYGYYGFYDPFYDPFYYSPYQRYQEQKFYLERELRGNERELAIHQEKYRSDGVITAKERRELEDDIQDVRKARSKLNSFLRSN